jgi:hypothetical protein
MAAASQLGHAFSNSIMTRPHFLLLGNRVGISIMRIVDAHKADRSGHGC